jgi:hypothetical protein
MKKNEYAAAEVVEIGDAQSVILGGKTPVPEIENLTEPWDRWYEA